MFLNHINNTVNMQFHPRIIFDSQTNNCLLNIVSIIYSEKLNVNYKGFLTTTVL